MRADTKESPRTHPRESSFVSLLSGWAQQGVDSFFATQRILLDLAMRQNSSIMNLLREKLTDPLHSPATILTEMAGEGITNFIEAHKVLLDLAQQQNEIAMGGVKQRLGGSTTAVAMTDLLRRSVDTFIAMQREFLKISGHQAHSWMEAAKTGKVYQPDKFIDLAREGVENFVHAQKRFLDVIAEETAKATGGKHTNGSKKMKKTELTELAKKAAESFMEAQKRLFDLASRQVGMNVKAAGKAVDMVGPFPFIPLADLTREGVKSYVDASKALLDVMLKARDGHKHEGKMVHHAKHPARPAHRKAAAHAAA